jgi:GNAT superfamily N-acetyltransferase
LNIALRRATSQDAETLATLGRETFTTTFGHFYPPQDLAAFLAAAHDPDRYRGWATDPTYGLWLAEQDGSALGYALAGPCHLPHPEVTADCGELWRIYVRDGVQGAGLGGRLIDTALNWLHRPGRQLWIGVWSENHGAQRFYARRGFAKVGEYVFPVGETRDREFILRREAD